MNVLPRAGRDTIGFEIRVELLQGQRRQPCQALISDPHHVTIDQRTVGGERG
jgi:hypothetical protein